MRSSTQAVVYAANTGVVGSQPEVYTMDDEILMAAMALVFSDDNNAMGLKNWVYTLDPNQENFPVNAVLHEGFNPPQQGGEKLCISEPKGCEGRVLRWFDLGILPKAFKDAESYLGKLHNGHLPKEYFNPKVTYWDAAIGPKNQIRLPNIPAIPHHVYYAVILTEGAQASPQSVDLNTADPDQYDQLLKMVQPPNIFVRGILVRALLEDITPNLREGATIQVSPALKTIQGGNQ